MPALGSGPGVGGGRGVCRLVNTFLFCYSECVSGAEPPINSSCNLFIYSYYVSRG